MRENRRPRASCSTCAALTFMDSTGLRLVIRWDTDAREDGFEFAIVPGPEVVQRVFRLTGMDDVIPIAEP